MIIPRLPFQEVAASGPESQPEFKSHTSSCCYDSHPQKREPGVSPDRTGGRQGKKEEGGRRREKKKGKEKNTPNFFICFHFI